MTDRCCLLSFFAWSSLEGGPNATTVEGCSYASDYADMIRLVRTLGNKPEGPEIYVAIPPPLMQHGSIGANQTV